MTLSYQPFLSECRRELHRIPELPYKEYKTQRYIASVLEELGVEWKPVAQTGIQAVIRSEGAKETLAFRADMDGLAVLEPAGKPFCSAHEGYMHACGHDGHMATLLGLAKMCAEHRDKLAYHVVFLFQPAEEGCGGAKNMVSEGVLQDPPVDRVYGFHLWPGIPVGKVGCKAGPIMAHTSEFVITLLGESAHGAMPHLGIDAVMAAARVIHNLQGIVTRNVDPFEKALISIGKVSAGSAANIIAEKAVLEGILRTFNDEVSQRIQQRIQEVLRGERVGFGMEASIRYLVEYPAVVNPEELVNGLYELVGPDSFVWVQEQMTAEDFSFFQKAVPGLYFFLGAGEGAPLHSEAFDFDETALGVGLEVYRRILEL
jgi:amidohydrolase